MPRFVGEAYYAREFQIKCTGLKPNTVHTFIWNVEGYSGQEFPTIHDAPRVMMANGSPTLITDSYGQIQFRYFYPGSTGTTLTPLPYLGGGAPDDPQIVYGIDNSVGIIGFGGGTAKQTFELRSADGSSYAKLIMKYDQILPYRDSGGDGGGP